MFSEISHGVLVFFIQVFIDGMARVLCMRNELLPEDAKLKPCRSPRTGSRSRSRRPRAPSLPKQANDTHAHAMYNERASPLLSTNNGGSPEQRPHPTPDPNTSDRNAQKQSPLHAFTGEDSQQALEDDVHDIRRNLRALLQRVQLREERNKVALEWKIVALVLDRIFFIMYLSAIIVSLATLFPKTY